MVKLILISLVFNTPTCFSNYGNCVYKMQNIVPVGHIVETDYHTFKDMNSCKEIGRAIIKNHDKVIYFKCEKVDD